MYTLVRRFHVLHSDPVQIPHRTTTMGTQCMHTGTTGRPVRLRPVAGISLLWYEETYARSRPGRTSVKWPPIRHHVSRAEGAVGGSLLLTHASFCRLFAAVSETHWPGPLIRYRTSVSQRFFLIFRPAAASTQCIGYWRMEMHSVWTLFLRPHRRARRARTWFC
jgi:hypothetical protein